MVSCASNKQNICLNYNSIIHSPDFKKYMVIDIFGIDSTDTFSFVIQDNVILNLTDGKRGKIAYSEFDAMGYTYEYIIKISSYDKIVSAYNSSDTNVINLVEKKNALISKKYLKINCIVNGKQYEYRIDYNKYRMITIGKQKGDSLYVGKYTGILFKI